MPRHLLRHHLTSTSTSTPPRLSLYFSRARLIDSLRFHLFTSPSLPLPSLPSPLDPITASHLIRCAPTPDSALSLSTSLPLPSPPPLPLLHSLASRLAISGRASALHSLLPSFPVPPSPLDRLRWFSLAGDLPSALSAWESLRATSPRGHPCTESYNLVIKLYVFNQNHSLAVSTFRRMVCEGAIPNSRTYTEVISHLVKSGFLEPALEVFRLLPSMRIRRTSKQYNVLGEVLGLNDRFDDLRMLIAEMGYDGILPGRQMRGAILKMREAGFVKETDDYVADLFPNNQIGYVVSLDDDEEEDGESSDEDVKDEKQDISKGGNVKLKPWMNPSAIARALEGWDAREVSELEKAKIVWSPRLVCKLLRAFKKPESAWSFFCWVAYQPGGFSHDCHTLARMVTILARRGKCELVDRLLSKVRDEGITLPYSTVRLIIDFYGLSKKADAAIRVFQEAEAVCGPVPKIYQLLLYSSLLRTMVKCSRGHEALLLLEEMIHSNILPDIQIFAGLIEYFSGIGDLKSVHKLFGVMRQCGLKPDAYTYGILIRAYCKINRSMLAVRVFDEMLDAGLVPDKATKELLVKSLWKEGKMREVAEVEERCEDVGPGDWPGSLPGHAWTVSASDMKRVYQIYSGCFQKCDQ
ncbi:Pentatricopeptide repeat-containing protein [Rhynchospora pubera]|uniref:Pentatricopeptide repeat-containing protein n=1 Tax=Rhynchospora pubera TaxID=906938 RepID=A0AAV8AKS9_9POAL|nr:Pentatricopeptide repeat-containing protein [Rhynchospora pubera]KAJ4800916.1 Pentatricopeptide repeat-containing protein [Rhynchospora pubera]KAJ4805908.1 Pentatricopeptide repeat-containing protein [Rhynchospora pubera]